MAGPGTPGWAVPAGEDYMVRRVADIERAQREGMASIATSFLPVIARLEAADVEILAQQATLAAQVAAIADLLANQLSFDGSTAIVNGVGIPQDTYGTVLTVTLQAPSWATRASITAHGVVTATSSGGAALIQGRLTIGGAASPNFERLTQTAGEDMTVTPVHYVTFDPGATIVVNLDARRTVGASGTALARLVSTALFLR